MRLRIRRTTPHEPSEKERLAEAKRMRAEAKERLREAREQRSEAIIDSLERTEFFDAADAYANYLGVETDEGSFIVDTADPSISRRLFAERTYAAHRIPEIQELLNRLGRPVAEGSAIVDIGSNLGMVAIGGIVAYGFGRAIAAEAHPPNRRLLHMNVILNGLEDRVQLLGALSDTDGEGMRSRGESASGTAAVEYYDGPIEMPTVRLSRLDTLIERGEVSVDDVGLVWMDVQGHEPLVLEGGRRLIECGAPMVVEFSPLHLRQRPDGLERMKALIQGNFEGFVDLRTTSNGDPEVLPPSAIESIAEELGDRFTDLLLLPR